VSFNFLSAVIRAVGDSRTPLLFLVISCLLNAGLVILFIGAFGMGVAGAAAATVLAQAISAVLCLLLVMRRMPVLALSRQDWRLRRAEFSDSSRLGLTMGFQMSVIAIGAVVLQYGINRLGAEAVAAFTAAMRVDQAAVAPLASVAVAMTTYTAQNFGAGQWWRIRVGVFRMSLVAAGLAIVLGGIITVFGTDIVRLFVGTGADRVVAMAHQYLVLNGSLYAVLALLFVVRNSLQGLGATVVPTIAGFMELALRSIAGLILIAHWGFLGACLAAPLAWVAALVPLLIAWGVERARLVRLEGAVTSLGGYEELPYEELPREAAAELA
jgi:Na+-driven multidrug efflux pump